MFWAIGCIYPGLSGYVAYIGTRILTKEAHYGMDFWRVVPIAGSGKLDKVQNWKRRTTS